MGLLQKAVETYDCHRDLIGVISEAQTIPLAPIAHTITNANLCIALDRNGKIIDAFALDEKILIPVTEASAGRSGTGAKETPHPLCDKLMYLSPTTPDSQKKYLKQLREWKDSSFCHPKLRPILTYVENGSILKDLSERGLIELDDTGAPTKKELLVCWRVTGLDSDFPADCWKDQSLFESFSLYYLSKKKHSDSSFCMITGELTPMAVQHPKGIDPFSSNAKLISANDNSGFTYRGRFANDKQALSVGYEASQKAHNALRWLIAEQGIHVVFGGRIFLCWNPKGHRVCSAINRFRKTDTVKTVPSDYREDLLLTLEGYKTDLPDEEDVVIAAFDAATSGRLSLTYYNELIGSDFLQRLFEWDLTCCWYNGAFGIQSPALRRIVDTAFGVRRADGNAERWVADDKVLRNQMQRLLSCRIDQGRIPTDIVKALVNRSSYPNGMDYKFWRRTVFVACAVLNKYESERRGQNIMAWNLQTPDRSFQFGRLLAAMERIELDYYDSTDEDRQTYAIKSLPVFRRSPYSAYQRINSHLQLAYIPRISNQFFKARYSRLRDEIMGIIASVSDDLDAPLDDIYLLGYDLQHAEFYKKRNTETMIKESEEE